MNMTLSRRLILFGAPLFTGVLLLFHSTFDLPTVAQPVGAVYDYIAVNADQFITVHLLFAPAIFLMGVAVWLLLGDMRTPLAVGARIAAGVWIVGYIMFESIVGTATGLLVRGALDMPLEQKQLIARAAEGIWANPLVGNFPSALSLIGGLGWVIAAGLCGVALQRRGAPIGACLLIGASALLVLHPPPFGPLAALAFWVGALWIEQRKLAT